MERVKNLGEERGGGGGNTPKKKFTKGGEAGV